MQNSYNQQQRKGLSGHKRNAQPTWLGFRIADSVSSEHPTMTPAPTLSLLPVLPLAPPSSFQSIPLPLPSSFQSELPPLPSSFQSEPSQSEPSQSEPSQSEPSQSEPSQSEPSQSEPSQSEPSQSEPSQSSTLRMKVRLPKSGPNTKWANPRKGCEVVPVRAHSCQDSVGHWDTTYYMETDGAWLKLESWERDRPFGHREIRELRRAVFTYWANHFDASRKVQFKMVAVYPGDYSMGGFLRKWTPKKQTAHTSRLMNGSKRFISNPKVLPTVDLQKPAVIVSKPAVVVSRPFRDPAVTRRFRDAIATIARFSRS